MPHKITETDVEELTIDLLEKLGYEYIYGPDIACDGPNPERVDYSQIILADRLKNAILKINPNAPDDAKDYAFKQVLNLPSQNLIANNEAFHDMLVNGIETEYSNQGDIRGEKVWLIDYNHPDKNEFLICNQFTVIEKNINKRPDIVLFINGLPLVVIELKNPADENATTKKAFAQLQTYKSTIPSLFYYNCILLASDGLDAKYGSLSAKWGRFMAWKTVKGKFEESSTTPQLETLIKGLLNKQVLLDIIKQFTVFEKSQRKDKSSGQVVVDTVKKVAGYHQYYAVNKAVESTIQAAGIDGSRKGGVVWHTQGSGKSLSMVFFAGKLVLSLDNPTILVITDRNDLDDQLFDTFAGSKQLLRQEPQQAESREGLRDKLTVAAGGIVFTTIQKFFPAEGEHIYPLLSERKNIVVIADEAHRSHYGFKAKTIYITDENGNDIGTRISYGFAKYIRDALPNATFLGFTGTPVEKEDANTPAVFGNYIDVYDIERAIADGATVRIYYESRIAKVVLKKEKEIDRRLDMVAEEAGEYNIESSKARWAKQEAIVGNPSRLKIIAKDIVEHFEQREEALIGKGMIVTMSRRIAVGLYDKIINLRPEWHNNELSKGTVKVVMTCSSSDPLEYQKHNTSKEDRRDLSDRFKNPDDPLELVIVIDMWLTGFDVPCLHTMYIDKPMSGHNLMQAIARVNRVYPGKDGGLIVDYIGIASDLKKALASYTESGGEGKPTLDQEEAVLVMQEKYEIVRQMFNSFDYMKYFKSDTSKKLHIILEAQEHILSLEDGDNRLIREVTALSKAYALSVPDKRALKIKDELGLFQAIKARFQKFEREGANQSDEDIDLAIRQIVDEAIVSEKVIDVFSAAGIKTPDISILSDEFLKEIRGMKQKNLAVELLKKLLNDEIKIRSRKNLVQGKKFSEMLNQAINKYHNKFLSVTELIEELIELGQGMREARKRGEDLGLTEEEVAFYDALEVNDSAVQVLGDEKLREIARVLMEHVKKNASIDWTIRESVRAKLRVMVKRILRKYGYPPDMQKIATDRILKQSEMLADYFTA